MKEKDLQWRGSSLKDLLPFPDEVRRDAGYQPVFIRLGLKPEDWKPVLIIGFRKLKREEKMTTKLVTPASGNIFCKSKCS